MFDETNKNENEFENNNGNSKNENADVAEEIDIAKADENGSEAEGAEAVETLPEEQEEADAEADKTEANEAEETIMEEPTDDILGGVAYTKNVDGEVSNGYEWNSSSEDVACQKKKTNGFNIFLGIVITIFALSFVTVAVMLTHYIMSDKKTDIQPQSNNKDIQNSENFNYNGVTVDNENYVAYNFSDHNGEVLSIPQVAAKCSPSSVGIISEVEVTYNYPFYFSPSTRVSEASGSGFIYSADGYVITNHHVIENANKITVVLSGGKEYDAALVGSDSLSDIAVLKITPNDDDKLIPMEIGDSSKLVVGEPVVAIGCPAGIEFIGTVTDGIISAINRNVEVTDSTGNVQKIMTLIQTNATINHGNSGGPLINAKGQVIGINTLKLANDYEGIGFSIPINGAVSIIDQLISHGKVIERTEDGFAASKGMIGINGSEITESEAEYYGIPKGVLVIQIDRDSSAAKAGLRRGDIITHYNGQEVSSVTDINEIKGSAMAGEEATLTVYREGYGNDSQTLDITFKLDPQE